MIPINDEPDYLQRLKNAKDNLIEMANSLQIIPDTSAGQTIRLILQILDKEIDGVEFIRKF